MSLPKFPENNSHLTRDNAINLIIASIAMEELSLSHILNAEGEKLQYALGTIEGMEKPEKPLTLDDLLELNNSIHKTLDSAATNQIFLKGKLDTALSASVLQGPKGDMGTILGSYDTFEELLAAHPTGTQGDMYLVGGELYTWDTENDCWESVGDMTGPPGPVGIVLGSFDTIEALRSAHPTGNQGDAYLVGAGDLYVWKEGASDWALVGNLQGPEGPEGAAGAEGPRGIQGPAGIQGVQGVPGTSGIVGGIYTDFTDLTTRRPVANNGEYALVGNEDDGYTLYLWDSIAQPPQWVSAGPFSGVVGPAGPEGPQGANSVILGSYDTIDELRAAHPTGVLGESYFVGGGALYTWIDDIPEGRWVLVGDLTGPAGTLEPGTELFTVHGSGNSVDVVKDGELHFTSSTLTVSVDSATSTVNIETPAAPGQTQILQFNSINSVNLATSATGQPTAVIAVGTGAVRALDTSMNPIRIPGTQIIPLKPFAEGTITELHFSLSTTETAHTDIPLTVYAQLYAAPTMISSELFPVEDTLVTVDVIPTGTPIGSLFTYELTDLSIPYTAETQLVIGFHCSSTAAISRQDVYLGGWIKVSQ